MLRRTFLGLLAVLPFYPRQKETAKDEVLRLMVDDDIITIKQRFHFKTPIGYRPVTAIWPGRYRCITCYVSGVKAVKRLSAYYPEACTLVRKCDGQEALIVKYKMKKAIEPDFCVLATESPVKLPMDFLGHYHRHRNHMLLDGQFRFMAEHYNPRLGTPYGPS